jgi:hypothetical protein
MTPSVQRGAQCPSAFELEAFMAGESATLAQHVGGCPSCGAYLTALRTERDAFNRMRPPELFLGQVERRAAQAPRRRTWWWLSLVPFAAAAAVVLALVAFPQHRDDGVTLKGPPFHVLVKRDDGGSERVRADQVLQAGDALRFMFDVTAAGQVAILDLDGTERVTTFYPANGTASAPVGAGADVLLPGSTVLDGAPGPEWLIAVFSAEPFDIAPLAAQLRGQSLRPSLELSCPGCQISTLRIGKAAR